jgi:predicted lactoylglutathione lyase
MLERVTLHVADLDASARFYGLVLPTLGFDGEGSAWRELRLAVAADGGATTNLHLGFAAPSRGHADAFWRAGTEAGHPDDGEPGARPEYGPDYYGAFLRDPDDNSAEAVHHEKTEDRHDAVDHLWIRVADLETADRFYSAVAERAGLGRRPGEKPRRVHFYAPGGSFSIVDDGPPSRNVDFALRAARGPSERLTDPDGNAIELVAGG